MSSVNVLQRKIDRMITTIDQRRQARAIVCAGAKEQLLAKLAALHDRIPEQERTPGTDADLERLKETLRARVEQYNLRFVSHEH